MHEFVLAYFPSQLRASRDCRSCCQTLSLTLLDGVCLQTRPVMSYRNGERRLPNFPELSASVPKSPVISASASPWLDERPAAEPPPMSSAGYDIHAQGGGAGSPLRALSPSRAVAAEGSPANRTIQALPLDVPNLQVWHSPPPRPSMASITVPPMNSDENGAERGLLNLHEAASGRKQSSVAGDGKQPTPASSKDWPNDAIVGFAL